MSLVEVGQIAAPHGVRGAARVSLFGSGEVVVPGVELTLGAVANQPARALVVRTAEAVPGKAALRVTFEGVASRDEIEALRGRVLLVPREALGDVDEDEFFFHDLIGAQVFDRRAPAVCLGTVQGVVTLPHQELLEVDYSDQGGADTWMLAAIPEYLEEVDVQANRIVTDLPEGMLPEDLERKIAAASGADSAP